MTIKLVGLGELLSRPVLPIDYLWQGRLVAGTTSIIAAKPKVGKSTLARNLALAVARGESFLGWPVKRGPVLYFSLEERSEDVTNDFRVMGADGHEDICITDAASVSEMVTALREREPPALLIVDPLFRLVRVHDGNSYSELYAALGPLIDTARETGTHILCLHHSSKMAKSNAIDAPIGSTALGGAVGTLLVMRRTESFRTLESVQRIGEDLSETVLKFDPVARRLSLGELREDAEVTSLGTAIMNVLATKPMTQPEIIEAVRQSKTYLRRKALRQMVELGTITRSSGGKRGDPFKYTIASSLSPAPIENNGTKKPFEDVSEETSEGDKKVSPSVFNIIGTKGLRNFDAPDECLNIDEKLSPAKTDNSANSEKPGLSNSGWWSTIVEGPENPEHVAEKFDGATGGRSRYLRQRRHTHNVTALRRRPRRR